MIELFFGIIIGCSTVEEQRCVLHESPVPTIQGIYEGSPFEVVSVQCISFEVPEGEPV